MKSKTDPIWQAAQKIALLLVIAPLTVPTAQVQKDKINVDKRLEKE
jgi:hypothetical protein